MKREKTTGLKQILAELSKIRAALAELDDFFRKTDDDISLFPLTRMTDGKKSVVCRVSTG